MKNIKNVISILLAILIQIDCASERKVCYEEYGVSAFDARRNSACILAYGFLEDSKNESFTKERRERALQTAEGSLYLCYYGLVAEADCDKKSDTKLSPDFRNPLW